MPETFGEQLLDRLFVGGGDCGQGRLGNAEVWMVMLVWLLKDSSQP